MNCTLRVVSNFLGAVQKNRDSPNHINILLMKKFTFRIYCAITIHSLQNEGSFYMIQKIEKGD